MHLIQVGYKEFINAEEVERIHIQHPIDNLQICSKSGQIYYVDEEYRNKAIEDILTNCTSTNGREALQGVVSE